MTTRYFCDICEEEDILTSIRVRVDRFGVVKGKCNETQCLEKSSLDVCSKCDSKIKNKTKSSWIKYLIINIIGGIK